MFDQNRKKEAELFGQRRANCFINAYIDQPENLHFHMRNWARVERQFNEWQFEKYRPELLP